MAKLTELRDMSDEQLGLTLKEATENLFRLRITSQTERLDAPSELRRNRRLVARIKTFKRSEPSKRRLQNKKSRQPSAVSAKLSRLKAAGQRLRTCPRDN